MGATLATDRRLDARLVRIPALPEMLRETMFGLYDRYYEATSQERFFNDLAAKDEAVLLYDQADKLRGFTTLKRIGGDWEGRPYRAIFSGDTIVHHRYWGEQALAFSWIRRAGAIKAEQPAIPLYWLLIVKGHRTYRYLQAFSRDYFPHWQRTTPSATQRMMNHLGTRLFGKAYRPERGVVSFPASRGQLRAEWAEPPPETLARPEVGFFLNRNPGYRRGEELLCLTELTPTNLRPLARRVFEQGICG